MNKIVTICTQSQMKIFSSYALCVMKGDHQWNLQSVLPRCAPRISRILRGGAGQGLLLRGGAAFFSAGLGGVGRGAHPWWDEIYVENGIQKLKVKSINIFWFGLVWFSTTGYDPKTLLEIISISISTNAIWF